MAIWVYGRIKEKSIDENLLEKSIIKYFDLKNHIIKKRNGKCVTYEGIGSENETEIICFYIYLRERIDRDILVTSDAHDEICLLKEKEIIWSKDLSYDYSKIIE